MDEDFEKNLLKVLKGAEKRSKERYDAATGSRGSTRNSTCDFYLGVTSLTRDVIAAIEKKDLATLKGWVK